MTVFNSDDDVTEADFPEELHEMNFGYDRSENSDSDAALLSEAGAVQKPDSLRERLLSESIGTIQVEKARARLEDERVKKTAKKELQQLYGDDFDLSDAPNSIDRYEKTLALERLRDAVVDMGKIPSERPDALSDEPQIDQAIATIEQMKTYGPLAEPHLADISRANIATMEVREAAITALEEIRDGQQNSHDNLREAIAAWIRPGGGD